MKAALANVSYRPRVCKNAQSLIVLGHWRPWWNDRMANAACCIGRDLEHVNAVFTASGIGQNQPLLCRQRLHQTSSTDDFHDPFQVVGEHIQAHLRAHHIHCLSVPKGCSTVRFRTRIVSGALLSRSCISSNTASCSQRRTRRCVLGVHCDFMAQSRHFELQ